MFKLVRQQTGIMHNAKDNVNLMFYLLAIYLIKSSLPQLEPDCG